MRPASGCGARATPRRSTPPAGLWCCRRRDIACRLPRAALVYQRTDDFKHFTGVNQDVIAGMDRQLVDRADLVIHVNVAVRGITGSRMRSVATSHFVDYDLFASELDQLAS